MKFLITGYKGQLGYDIVRELEKRGYKDYLAIDKEEMDITDREQVFEVVKKYNPDVIFHCAAWTAVDKAEDFPEKVFEVNANGTKNLSNAAKKNDAKIVYISTDYVFDGQGETPFEIDSIHGGLSVYGKSKAKGEDYVREITNKYFIIRISWAFGKNGNNFVKTMLKLASMGRKELNVVPDQIGSVTYTKDLAVLICDMIATEKYGTYHATNEGFISWADFAEEIFRIKGLDVKINRVTTSEYLKLVPSQAIRPLNSRLSKKSLDEAGFNRLPTWKDALERYLEEIKDIQI